MKQFNVMLSKEKIEALEKKIKEQGKTKVEWFTEKVDEELSQKNNSTVPTLRKLNSTITNQKFPTDKSIISV